MKKTTRALFIIVPILAVLWIIGMVIPKNNKPEAPETQKEMTKQDREAAFLKEMQANYTITQEVHKAVEKKLGESGSFDGGETIGIVDVDKRKAAMDGMVNGRKYRVIFIWENNVFVEVETTVQ